MDDIEPTIDCELLLKSYFWCSTFGAWTQTIFTTLYDYCALSFQINRSKQLKSQLVVSN
jgi:hypothetical protein